MYLDILLPFVGGLGMFIYGMQIMAQGLENAAGDRMRSSLEALTKNKFFGVLLGAFITAVIQSSSATTVMVVGFVNAGIMNLQQAMGVIMGANIGTTITGWLVSSVEWASYLSPSVLAPGAIFAGVVILLAARHSRTREIAKIILGFGLLFVGITTMSAAVEPLQQSQSFRSLFVLLGSNPLLGIAAGAIVTAIIQSSSASVGILQSLAAAGLVPFGAAVYIIMGQNIGTCATALLSGVGAKRNARTASLMHLLFNIIGTVIFSAVSILYLQLAQPLWAEGPISQTEISLIHTVFNIATTILLFPVSDQIIKLAKRIGRAEEQEQDEGRCRLDPRVLETPAIALRALQQEAERMGEMVESSLSLTRRLLDTPERAIMQAIHGQEENIDRLTDGISDYAIRLSARAVESRERESIAAILQILTDMERIGDHCENLCEYAEQMVDKRLTFSETGKRHLEQMAEIASESYTYALRAFREKNPDFLQLALEKENETDELERRLRDQHIRRITEGRCSTQAGILFLDALNSLERISDHAKNIAEASLPKT